MTYKEKMSAIQSALKSINDDGYIDIANHGCPDERNELEVIKEALEKQEAKKLVERNAYKHCPLCDSIVFKQLLFGKPDYCPNCGQAIDWSE